jgi:DNA repair exonuclease SbcCD ATPase subunit
MSVVVQIKKKLGQVFSEEQASVLSEVITDAYRTLVKSDDFQELKAIVKDLAEAQKQTELKVGELAEAQKRTEQKVGELVEAQKRTEQRVEELAEAQKRTEVRLEELAEAQKRTEQKVGELAEAQKRTEAELHQLVYEHQITRKQLGGLSMTVGYTLENEAYKWLPALLEKDFGIIVKDRLKRKYVVDNSGKHIEVNIIGEASKNGKEIVIIGEAKSQLSKNDVDDFVRKKLKRVEGVWKAVFPVLVTHMIAHPDVEEYVKEKDIALYYSYDLTSS